MISRAARCFVALLVLSLARASGLAAETRGRPNFIIVLADDLGWNEVGFTGNSFVDTPVVDALAARGLVFSQAYASAPNCAPTRACLLTGQVPPRHGIFTVVDDRNAPGSPDHPIIASDSRSELATEAVTLAEVLRDAGYATGFFGMWNLGRGRKGPRTPEGQGFDRSVQARDLGFATDAYFSETGTYLTDALADACLAFMREHADRPWFVYLAPHATHAPYDPKPELLRKYEEKSMKEIPSMDPGRAATIEALDQNVGRLWQEVEAAGLTDQTVLFFTSDNGGDHRTMAPLRGGKGTLYEGGLRVPFCAVGTGIAVGRQSVSPIASVDLFPTMLELAGLPPPAGLPLDGRSLVDELRGQGSLDRTTLFWHFPCYAGRGKPSSAVRQGDMKLIEFFEDARIELYNLARDPGETRNLSEAEPGMAAELLAVLRTWQGDLKAPCPTTPNPLYQPDAGQNRSRNQRGKGGKNVARVP
ncbi:MAG: sulfatase [Opitutaceae bacterium]